MTGNPGMALLDREIVVDIIDRKIRSGWTIVSGNGEAVIALEQEVYTPGTPANGDFIAFLLPTLPPRSLYLARKTDRLKALLLSGGPVADGEWCHIIGIRFDAADGEAGVQTTLRMLPNLSRTGEVAELAVSGGFP